jgi:hypothetical protein
LAIDFSELNGFASPANWAKKIAGPLMVVGMKIPPEFFASDAWAHSTRFRAARQYLVGPDLKKAAKQAIPCEAAPCVRPTPPRG